MKLLTAFIFLVSFLSFSLYFSPYVTSDDALNVLIANTYHLPHDIYCWGQDRGGTLIPLLSQPFIWIGITPLLAVSLSNYFILFLGYYGFSKLFRHNFTKLLFAILWFLPFERFIYISSFPIGMSYSLIGFSVVFLLKIIQETDFEKKSFFHKYKNYLFLTIIWGIAVWVSDLAFLSILVLFFSILINRYKENTNSKFLKQFLFMNLLSFALIGIAIKIFKSFSTGITENYQKLNSINDVKTAIGFVIADCKKVLLFDTKEIFVSVSAWILIMLLIYLIISTFKKIRSILSFQNIWINFFLFDFISILGVIFLSHWVLLNNMGRWYFVAPYISFILLLVSTIESNIENISPRIKAALIFAVLLVSLSSILTPFIKLKENYMPMSSKLSELDRLGKIGIIADYWDAYRCSMLNPENIKSTPHEGSDVKNPKLVSEVFNQPKIFISRDMWFDKFPDSMTQFGIKLIKTNSEFLLGGSNLCQYKIKPVKNCFEIQDLKIEPSIFDSMSKTLKATLKDNYIKNKYIVFGPDVSLLSGNYIIRYYCSSSTNNSNESTPIVLDISSDYGKNILYYEEISNKRLYRKKYIDIHFKAEELLQHTEFRVIYKGFENINFSKIELMKVK